MRYIFKILILGSPEVTPVYVSYAFNEEGEDKGSYIEYYREISVLEDMCDLEIDVITDLINVDYDEIIPIVDGIIYFLNPTNKEEVEFFEMILPIINSVKRNLPMVVIYFDPKGIIPIPVNELLEDLWMRYPQLEGFVNLRPREFHQAIQCLCMAMIAGDTPLNIENAWMRFPILIKLANNFFKQKQYFYAAQAIRKAALIAEILNREDMYIMSEKAALLYSKANLYLEAAKILQNVDRRKAINFKKLYAESMLLEGNKLFNKSKYEEAARQYLAAAHWSAIELEDQSIKIEAFKLAINSWISACKVEKAFDILDNLPHDVGINTLNEIADKISAVADFLIEKKDFIGARDQLYHAILVYQREGLFDHLKKFTKKLETVLIELLKKYIDLKDKLNAKKTFDEIENLWLSYDIDKTNIDTLLDKLIKLFLDDLEFSVATELMNKISSFSLKQQLTELSTSIEEKHKITVKEETLKVIREGLDVVKLFVESENEIIKRLNEKVLNKAETLKNQGEILKAANLIKKQAEFYKQIGKSQEHDEMIEQALKILLNEKIFNLFFKYFGELSKNNKKLYLVKIFPKLIEKLIEIKEERSFEQSNKIFEISGAIYRNQMLYEEAKRISRLYIDAIKKEAMNIIETKENLEGINRTMMLVRKALNISKAYLEDENVNLDEIYKNLVEIYLKYEDFSSAYAINEKIQDGTLRSKLHAEISKKETKKRTEKLKEVEASRKEELLEEMASIMENRAREALNDKKAAFKQRKALKRVYFEKALEFLKNQMYDDAVEQYKNSINRLIKIKKYDLASISLAVLGLILLKQEKIGDIKIYLNEIKNQLSGFGQLISETFPFGLLEYIVDLKYIKDDKNYLKAIKLMKNLPLFEEEELLLQELLSEDITELDAEQLKRLQKQKQEKLIHQMKEIAKKLLIEKSDKSTRKLMKSDYWGLALEDLSRKKFINAKEDYLESIKKLAEKKFFKHVILSLMLATLLEIKVNNVNEAIRLFNKEIEHLKGYYLKIDETLEIRFFKLLLEAFEGEFFTGIEFGIKTILEKFNIFEEEKKFLELFLAKKPEIEETEEEKKEIMEKEETTTDNILVMEIEQELANIKQAIIDLRGEREDLLRKRKALKRRYYNDILNLLKEKKYQEASEKYMEVSLALAKRKDFLMSSILILLHGLTLMKAKSSHVQILSNLNEYLNSLGLNKKIVEDTLPLRSLKVLIKSLSNNLPKYVKEIKNLVKELPLFKEEIELIE